MASREKVIKRSDRVSRTTRQRALSSDPMGFASEELRRLGGFAQAKEIDSMGRIPERPVRQESDPFYQRFTPRESV